MSAARTRVVMLAGQGMSSNIMYNALSHDVDILAVIQESRQSRKQLLRRRIKKLGLTRVAGQILFTCYDRLYLKHRQLARIETLIERYRLDTTTPAQTVIQTVDSINSDRTIELLEQLHPDAVVVNGTRIISTRVLSCVSAPFLNTHAGITPRYRGVHGGYWALASRDPQHCGVTVHLVDAGIDTGGVLYQANIETEAGDGFNTYPVHQIAKAIPLMKKALRDAAAMQLKPGPGVGPSRLWSHPTLLEYLRHSIARNVR